MVVFNGPMLNAPAACPVTPPFPFCPALSPVSPFGHQRFPPPTIFTGGAPQLYVPPAVPTPPGVVRTSYPPSPLTPDSESSASDSGCSSSGNSSSGSCGGGAVIVVPYTTGAVVQCRPYPATNSSLAPVVPCQPKLVSGPSVLQCTPGVCQMAPAALFSSMCSISPSSVVPTSPVFPLPPASVVDNCTASSWKQSYGMEQVWLSEFRTLFMQYAPHMWMLVPVNAKPSGLWHTSVDSAKVRFCCVTCARGWTTMKGRVAFWFILNPSTGEGAVCLKLYGQQCDRCKTGNYEQAMWYPEEVTKVLVNIYNRVGQVYYGFQQAPYHKARRPGKPRTPHNSDLCQACQDGVCSERR